MNCPSVQVGLRQKGFNSLILILDIKTATDMIDSRGKLQVIFIELILDSGPSLTLWRLQVLFHSLSKVLFIFRSRYLFAIGLPKIFSLSRGIPAISHCIPKQYYSEYKLCSQLLKLRKVTGLSPSLAPLSRRTYLSPNHVLINYTILHNSTILVVDSAWAFPSSLAATRGITVVLFSSA